jgi:metal-responsive CopG/Arc/MetJ family transcriptional regulator
MANSPVVTLRLEEIVLERVDEAVAKASEAIGKNVSRSAWITQAIILALEKEEAPHVPAKVKSALPRRMGNRMIMPEGITYRNI